MRKTASVLWLAAAVLLSAGGLAFSLWLTISNFNLIWAILSPVIIAFYQSPAALAYRLWRRRNKARGEPPDTS
ncbi:MAG: hypothetical protein FJY83_01185 [Candidatus Aminicenantes bacterium]|nr:hypothetical protein [Candidatus Aminicenantes bacterium]